ncbi:MAG: hypothetical protein A2268_15480 [Candidatus Raymondbacteria bacterium RifOxyA12_full_50_37]|nr:MAG: hypothetical protein A2268_15480 [Candidatus Raymondbacteria bacterium RifOxyA12_full_50_37]OGJ87295.1 MAG: hypothetical protein A2350_04415 [Candidatus Raymondbacteria bacterium RifOxyB12_full_50_8]OGJ88445.1 MAG: hypothetical protein A2248_19785 [Candidatus Raymondbacteria bacterium RIFOXYA2_FULL_49_16]OGJ98905.1 MAG: hypothetical protein A2453_10500 [Candidatus Raymondbacteria bacterium RIFOXYC2_FULL_50_21]OGK02160.1 MAG: hypothetical protein A2487_05180 [Candidatus Raymondbacteria b
MKHALASLCCLFFLLTAFARDFSVYTIIDQETKDSLRANWLAKFTASGYTHGNVAVFGNSITNTMAFWSPFASGSPGPVPGTNASSYTTNKDNNTNCAVSGYTIVNGLQCLAGAMEALTPEVMLAEYGTNDITKDLTGSFGFRYKTYVTVVLNKGVIPILSTIPPLQSNGTDYSAQVAAINDSIKRVAREKHAVVVDFWQAFMDHTGNNPFSSTWYGDQYVHPSGGAGLTDTSNPGCGYAIRNAVSWHAVNKVYRIIIENGTPDPVGSEKAGLSLEPGVPIQAYPNPFNEQTRLIISGQRAPGEATMDITIFNVHGRLIERLTVDARQLSEGIIWNASSLPAGVYFAHTTTDHKAFSTLLFLKK